MAQQLAPARPARQDRLPTGTTVLLALTRKKATMPSTRENLHELPGPGENGARPDAARAVHGTSVLPSGPSSLGRRPAEAVPAPAATAEPEEVLIQDLRGHLTPAQMVEHKVLALLRQTRRAGQPHEADGPADLPRGAGRRARAFEQPT
jgi:hypothetical protein